MIIGIYPNGEIEYFGKEGTFTTWGMDLVFQYNPRSCEIEVFKDRYCLIPSRNVSNRKEVVKILLKYA